jgi:hypothetical protein
MTRVKSAIHRTGRNGNPQIAQTEDTNFPARAMPATQGIPRRHQGTPKTPGSHSLFSPAACGGAAALSTAASRYDNHLPKNEDVDGV